MQGLHGSIWKCTVLLRHLSGAAFRQRALVLAQQGDRRGSPRAADPPQPGQHSPPGDKAEGLDGRARGRGLLVLLWEHRTSPHIRDVQSSAVSRRRPWTGFSPIGNCRAIRWCVDSREGRCVFEVELVTGAEVGARQREGREGRPAQGPTVTRKPSEVAGLTCGLLPWVCPIL